MYVFYTRGCPCLSEFASQGGSPRLVTMPVASFLLVATGQWPLGSIRLGFQFQQGPSSCMALDLSFLFKTLCPQG